MFLCEEILLFLSLFSNAKQQKVYFDMKLLKFLFNIIFGLGYQRIRASLLLEVHITPKEGG